MTILNLSIILCVCSGLMLPGLNAIMGPTGSGKTTQVFANYTACVMEDLPLLFFISWERK